MVYNFTVLSGLGLDPLRFSISIGSTSNVLTKQTGVVCTESVWEALHLNKARQPIFIWCKWLPLILPTLYI